MDNTPTYIRVKVIPNSQKTELVEIMDEPDGQTYKIRVHAAPERGKANTELIKFLSKNFNIHKSQITIISGIADRLKLIKITKTTK